ncbi:MAG: hypothetical protein HON47_03215 [Candidatus Diapherotrites archaeon]|jgi:hypothetical protein|uniref:Uncharacterized protein n=1 Tax=Candidatus Iainarchaeum sp. TaxID=3101447 RepID=A0A8T5GGC0_9ARCH|nr:hypothetical protein [Candidatus Diapherotrites archaeon]
MKNSIISAIASFVLFILFSFLSMAPISHTLPEWIYLLSNSLKPIYPFFNPLAILMLIIFIISIAKIIHSLIKNRIN